MAGPFNLTQWSAAHPYASSSKDGAWRSAQTLNCAKQNVGAGEVAQVINVPAGTWVLGVYHKVLTPEGGTMTYDIGDGATVDGYVDGADGNASTVGFSFDGTTTEAFGSGKFYATADTIDVTCVNAGDKMVLYVEAIGFSF